MSSTIRVLVFDDEALMRTRLCRLLSTAHNIEWVGEITAMQYLLPHCLELQPHVLLIGGGYDTICF